MGLGKVPFKTCYGEEKLADKLAIFRSEWGTILQD